MKLIPCNSKQMALLLKLNYYGWQSPRNPYLDEVSKWLRDKHGIFLMCILLNKDLFEVCLCNDKTDLYSSLEDEDEDEHKTFDTWEQAQSAGIDFALDYLIENKK